nr:T9SS type A sorting domain-containing protein [Polaribacter sp. DS7-9]
MYTIHNIPSNSLDIFSGSVSDKKENIVSLGNQVEGITLFETTSTKHRLYISNERYTAFLGSLTFLFPAKLWIVEIDVDTLSLNTSDEIIVNEKLNISPNPFYNTLNLSKVVDEATIIDLSGKTIDKQYSTKKLSLGHLQKGIYILKTKKNNAVSIEKIFKL